MSKLTRENAIVPLTAGMDLTGYIGCPIFIDGNGNAVVIEEPTGRPYGILLTEGKEGEQVSVVMWGCGGTVLARVTGITSPQQPGQILSLSAGWNGAATFTRETDNHTVLSGNIAARLVHPVTENGLHEVVLINPPWVEV